ncbi:MAG: YfcE family phosphodiesterase [Erysipelotrichaceae bacterium]
MLLLLMSDTHGELSKVKDILQVEHDVDQILHCGDVGFDLMDDSKFLCVKGNHDENQNFPKTRMITILNHRILMLHGDRFEREVLDELCKTCDVNDYVYEDCINIMNQLCSQLAKENNCDMVCYGHTHYPVNKMIDGVHVLNPGSLFYNANGGASYMVVSIDYEEVLVRLCNV